MLNAWQLYAGANALFMLAAMLQGMFVVALVIAGVALLMAAIAKAIVDDKP